MARVKSPETTLLRGSWFRAAAGQGSNGCPPWEVTMLEDTKVLQTLRRHWEFPGEDEDVAHGIYRDDAVLEFPQSGERFEGVQNFGNGVGSSPRSSSSTCEASTVAMTWS